MNLALLLLLPALAFAQYPKPVAMSKPATCSTTVTANCAPAADASGKAYMPANVGIATPITTDILALGGKLGLGNATAITGKATFYSGVSGAYFHLDNRGDSTFRLSQGASVGTADLFTVNNSGTFMLGLTTDTTSGSKFQVAGNIQLSAGTTTAQPTCDATHAGVLNYSGHTASVKDTVAICAADASNVYAWRTIY